MKTDWAYAGLKILVIVIVLMCAAMIGLAVVLAFHDAIKHW